MDNKTQYFVSLQSKEISTTKHGNNDDYIIFATEDEVENLRKKFDVLHEADMGTFWRAHIPFKPYHDSPASDDYDTTLQDIIEQLYSLGSNETKDHLVESNLLTNQGIDKNRLN